MSKVPQQVNGQPLNAEQAQYLEGFFAGVQERGLSFGDVAPTPVKETAPDGPPLCKEEKIKAEYHPFEAFPQLLDDAKTNKEPEAPNVFRFKWNGLFWLNPVHQAYMCRLRIPGGFVTSHQVKEIAAISRELTTGYIQITTRNNFQLRNIEPKDCPELLRRIESVGLHSRGAGADNVRNITANPTAGIDPYELIDVTPFVRELAQRIISTREFYDLPRKFNIAFDGGGLIGAVEDTNDIGAKAFQVLENNEGIEPGVYFRIKLGGVTGHQTFAKDWGVLVSPDELMGVILAILRVFTAHGDRTNRKKARLKYLLEKWGFETFREEVEKDLGQKLRLVPEDAAFLSQGDLPQAPHSHVGVYPQKQDGLHYVGVSVPVGQLSPDQLDGLAELAETYGSGDLRLTVWQNLLITDVPKARIAELESEVRSLGLTTTQSHLHSGVIACTGNRYCKFSAADTKGHAIAMVGYLEERVALDKPLNIHFTGCPHSCAQHYIGDLGLLGAKMKVDGESVEGYHVFVGGGFGDTQAVGRKLMGPVEFEKLKPMVENLLKAYTDLAQDEESFQDFTTRHDVETLQSYCGLSPVA